MIAVRWCVNVVAGVAGWEYQSRFQLLVVIIVVGVGDRDSGGRVMTRWRGSRPRCLKNMLKKKKQKNAYLSYDELSEDRDDAPLLSFPFVWRNLSVSIH